jgi:hypothetical protein
VFNPLQLDLWDTRCLINSLIVGVLCVTISIFLSGPLRAFLSLFGAVLAVIAAFIIMRRSRS